MFYRHGVTQKSILTGFWVCLSGFLVCCPFVLLFFFYQPVVYQTQHVDREYQSTYDPARFDRDTSFEMFVEERGGKPYLIYLYYDRMVTHDLNTGEIKTMYTGRLK